MSGQGFASRCALGVESSWGGAVAFTELVPFTSESINRAIAQIQSQYLDGKAGLRSLKNSSISVVGALEGEMVYDEITGGIIGIERLISSALGTGTWDAANSLTKYTLAEALTKSYTIGFNKQTSVWEIAGAKVNNLKISGNAGEAIKFSADIIGRNLLRTGDTGIVNAAAAITGIAPTNVPSLVYFDDLIFRLADQSNGLVSGDRFSISGFELSINNNLSDSTFATIDSTNTDIDLTLEPERNGFREITLSITMPRYTADTIFDWLNADTGLMADLLFTPTGGDLLSIFLPNIKVGGDPTAPIGGAEIIEASFNFTGLRNAGTNSYLTLTDTTAIAEELAIECKSNRTSAA